MSWTLKQLGAQVDDVVDEMDTDVDDFRCSGATRPSWLGPGGEWWAHTLSEMEGAVPGLWQGVDCISQCCLSVCWMNWRFGDYHRVYTVV